MVDIRNQDNSINVEVMSLENSNNLSVKNDSSVYYSSLAKSWANRLDGTVDGLEYSSKYYAQLSKDYSEISQEAKNNILENAGFQIVAEDLTGENAIKLCADNMNSIQNAASNAQIASEKAAISIEQAEIATQKAQEIFVELKNYLNISLSNITDAGRNVILNNSKGMPIGTIIPLFSSSNYIPEGCLPCDGGEYSREMFPDLYDEYLFGESSKLLVCDYDSYNLELSTYGQCAKFGIDTTNLKFKVPTIKDGSFIQQAQTTAELGKAYKAGLPNITGSVWTKGAETLGTGCFGDGASYNSNTYGGAATTTSKQNFNASLSSSIYKDDCNTVQPEAVALRYFVVVTSSQTNQSLMDWSAWATSLTSKMSKGDFCIESPTTSSSASLEKPAVVVENYINEYSWYRLWSDGFIEQGGILSNAIVGGYTSKTITFLKPFSSNNYSIFALGNWSNADSSSTYLTVRNTTNFTLTFAVNNLAYQGYWEAKGY